MEAEASTHGLRRNLDGWNRLLVVVLVASSAIYFFTLSLQPYPGSIVLKGLSVSTLALVVFRLLGSRDGLILAVSLLFSSIGDVLLDVPGEKMFLFGLVSFLVAHLLYIVLFARNFPRPLKSSPTQKLIIVAVPIYSVIMTGMVMAGTGRSIRPGHFLYLHHHGHGHIGDARRFFVSPDPCRRFAVFYFRFADSDKQVQISY